MNTTIIRQQLHNYLETVNDKKLKAIYTIVEGDIQENIVEYTDEFKKELDKRHAAYKDGTEKTLTPSESKKRIEKILKSAKK